MAKLCYHSGKSKATSKKISDGHLAYYLCIHLLGMYGYSFMSIQAQTYFTFEWYISAHLKKKKKRPLENFNFVD